MVGMLMIVWRAGIVGMVGQMVGMVKMAGMFQMHMEPLFSRSSLTRDS